MEKDIKETKHDGSRANGKAYSAGRNNKQKYKTNEIYLSNAYYLGIAMIPRNKLTKDEQDEFKKVGAFKDFPFYVMERMRLKTVVGLIEAIADYKIYKSFTKLYEFGKYEALYEIFDSNKTVFSAFNYLDKAVNWGQIGVTPMVKTDDPIVTCYDADGNLIKWYRDKRQKGNLKGTNEFALIEKDKILIIANWFKDFFVKNPDLWNRLSIREVAAIHYLSWIVRQENRDPQ